MLIFKAKNTLFIIRHPNFFGGINVEYDEFNNFITVSYGHSLLRAQYKLDGGMKIIDMKRKLRNVNDPAIQEYYRRDKHDKITRKMYGIEDRFINVFAKGKKKLGIGKVKLLDAHLAETLDKIRSKKEQLENINLVLHDLKRAKKGLVNFVDDLEKIEEE